jgi:sugar diacid utilization regulator
LVTEAPKCHLGSSDVVALRDVASGYEQAFHALTAAAVKADRMARYEPGHDLVSLLREDARAWAVGVLQPLLEFRTSRRNEPDAEELLATLRSRLYFQTGAPRQLKVHRNTLAARLRLIETLLKVDLRELSVQATLQLAVRVQSGSPILPSEAAGKPSSEAASSPTTTAGSDLDVVLEAEAGRSVRSSHFEGPGRSNPC